MPAIGGVRLRFAPRLARAAGELVRQLLAESGLLSLAGGTLGLVAGFAGMRALLALDTAGLPRLGEAGALAGLDWRVIAFTVVLAFATTLVFGLAPALAASRVGLVDVIKARAAAPPAAVGRANALGARGRPRLRWRSSC